MTWAARLRLVGGLLVVLVGVGALTLHLNGTKGLADSASASVKAHTYEVGSAYAGLVLEQHVVVGDVVRTGDPLYVIDSATLRHDVLIGLVEADGPGADVSEDGHLTVTATGDGTVVDVAATRGTFVQAGSPLATVERAGTRYVSAEYLLTPEQFARLEDRATVTVTFPDRSTMAGTVDAVEVVTADGQAEVVVTVESPELVGSSELPLTTSGTPVVASLHLRNDGVVTRVGEQVQALLDEVGG